MIEIGRNIRWETPYEEEVKLSQSIGCTFMQVWFYKGDILINSNGKDKVKLIKTMNYPIVIHAVIDLVEFKNDVLAVLKILKELNLKELIIHPNSKIRPIDSESIYKLRDKIDVASKLLMESGIKLYIENNCRISQINYSSNDVSVIFKNNSDIEQLIDIAHVDSYEHLSSLKNIKYPKMLHLADKHFDVDHEHLPIGEGELDFEMIFKDILNDYSGKVILEIDQNDSAIIDSTRKIKEILSFNTIK